MAELVRVVKIDDLDASTGGVKKIKFKLDGHKYEIDLCERNAEALRSALRPYIKAGRRIRARRRPAKSELRTWARERGLYVCDHGSVPRAIVAAYKAAHEPGAGAEPHDIEPRDAELRAAPRVPAQRIRLQPIHRPAMNLPAAG